MGRRLLIIDDNPFVCAYLKDRLETMGYTVIVAHDGRTGLALIALETKEAPIEGVLLDLHMPIMDGMQVLRELRIQQGTVPVIMMTADPDERCREKALSLGVNHYIMKPIDPFLFAQVCQQTFPLAGRGSSDPS
jgi:two-component system alkaline phosphatase synthesis response regulator PhoP